MDLAGSLGQALDLLHHHDFPAAERIFLDLLKAFPGEPNTCNFLGLLRRYQGRLPEAETLIRQAIRGYPAAGAFYNNLANVLADLGRPDAAMEAYREALQREPGLLDARFNLANLCLQAGNRPEAMKQILAAFRQAPDDPGLLGLYGSILGIGRLPGHAPLPSPPVSPWLGSPYAFLAEPDWQGDAWVDLVQDFALSFAAWEPVSLILFLDPFQPGHPQPAEATARIRAGLAATGLEGAPPVRAVSLAGDLPGALAQYRRAHWLHLDPAIVSGLEGQVGIRLAVRRYARSQETRPGPPFFDTLRRQVLEPFPGPPWAADPMGTTFMVQAAWPDAYLGTVLEAFRTAFGPADPAACLLLADAGTKPPGWLDAFLGPGSRIHWQAGSIGYLDHLRRYPKILRVAGPPGETAGLEGRLGLRFAAALRRGLAGSPTPSAACPPRPAPGRRLKVVCFSSEASRHATFQLRIGGPAWAHRDRIELQVGRSLADPQGSPFDLRTLRDADLVLLQRFFPRNDTRAYLDAIFSCGKPVLVETDDLVHCIPESNPNYQQSTYASDFLLDAMARASSLVVSTPVLGEELAAINPRFQVMPNLLDPRFWGGEPAPLPEAPVIIGYCGTLTHFEDLEIAEEALVRIAEKHGSGVAFRFFGCVTPRLERLPAASVTPFRDGYEAYATTLKAGGMHIALAPLVDHRFNRCKSHIKWLEYSALGAAGVYADLAPYRAAVKDGETGILAAANPQSWFQALDHLVGDASARRQMAARARREVFEQHLLGPASPWLGILEQASGIRRS